MVGSCLQQWLLTALIWRSAGCNTLRQWDLTRAVPRLVRDVKLAKGDIMGIATRKGHVYTCGADGSIR
jgi:pleiotropic regulator 1